MKPPLVLIIEDNIVVRRSFEYILREAGIATVSAQDGIQGMRIFREYHPNIVITDIIMPEQEGIETIRQIRREGNSTQIIAISGGGRVGNLDFLTIATRFGANVTLAKPLEAAQLLGAVRNCLRALSGGTAG
jgi:DNA-binding response OmpR family regulator